MGFSRNILKNVGFQKYFFNTGWMVLEKIIRLIVSFLVGTWIARYLMPESYGILSYASSFVGLFAALANLGLDQVVVRDLAKSDSNKHTILGTSFIIKFISGSISFSTIFLLMLFLPISSNIKPIIFILASGFFFQSFNIIDLYFQANVKSKYSSVINIFSLIFSNILKICLIILEAPLLFFAISLVFDILINTIGYLIITQRFGVSIFHWKFDKKLSIQLIKSSLPLALSGLIISFYMRIDQLILMKILGEKAVGVFAAAVRISECWYFVPMVIANSLLPAIVNAKALSEELYLKRLQNLYTFMFWFSFLIALLTTLFSVFIIKVLYGIEYFESGKILMVHIWGGLSVSLGVVWSNWVLIEKKNVLTLINNISGLIINIILNFILIKKYGITGAAYATLVSYIIGEIIAFSLYKPGITLKLIKNAILFR